MAQPQAIWIKQPQAILAEDAGGGIVVDGGRIVELVPAGATPRTDAAVFDASAHVVLPGLINTHTHAAMSLFRGIADDLKLQDWLNNYIFPGEAKNVNPDFVRWGTRLASLEMLSS